ncbi:protein of unknown function [Carnobacterium alterfunditum]|uniref:DUF4153 domain-containing protein n=1 Tax=Carnobacterium alterfunditum TaxID=28230 RepID=A0A1N6G1T0_9LACT|nr:DUF4153 domain-containing protein [Carnobacterium alterfunditum]SIO01464.1 protein of unknown function [Carnobacterium alterfunditum]
MKLVQIIQGKFQGLIQAIRRYPLTVIFLVAVAGLNAYLIQQETDDYTRYLYSFIVGVFLSVVAQHLYESLFGKMYQRIVLMVGTLLLTTLYYYTIGTSSGYDLEMYVKTGIIIFILTIAFMWIPTIKNRITFNQSYLSAFKALFITLLFTMVLFAGINLIIVAIDQLLFSVDEKVNMHTFNLIGSLFSPIFFLSYTPLYVSKKDESTLTPEKIAAKQEQIKEDISVPKVLELLISYIIIPLTAIFTIILLIYLLQNITGDFWTNNLLEPMLVSYSITVIVVYLLASNIETKSAVLFRKIFPKVLVPIVLFQTISSILKIQETGLTHGRYYVILFGLFAVIAGLIFSILPIRKNGWVAVVLIVLSVISLIPPVDAFTVSRVSQTNLLKETLEKNQMLEGNSIIPNADIPKEDKIKISQTIHYLTSMDYSKEIAFLEPYDQELIYQFEEVVGFKPIYDGIDFVSNQLTQDSYHATLDWNENQLISIEGYDKMVAYSYYDSNEISAIDFKVEDSAYTIGSEVEDEQTNLVLTDENDKTILSIDLQETMEQIATTTQTKTLLTVEEATVITGNEQAEMKLVFRAIDFYNNQYNSEFYLFIDIK